MAAQPRRTKQTEGEYIPLSSAPTAHSRLAHCCGPGTPLLCRLKVILARRLQIFVASCLAAIAVLGALHAPSRRLPPPPSASPSPPTYFPAFRLHTTSVVGSPHRIPCLTTAPVAHRTHAPVPLPGTFDILRFLSSLRRAGGGGLGGIPTRWKNLLARRHAFFHSLPLPFDVFFSFFRSFFHSLIRLHVRALRVHSQDRYGDWGGEGARAGGEDDITILDCKGRVRRHAAEATQHTSSERICTTHTRHRPHAAVEPPGSLPVLFALALERQTASRDVPPPPRNHTALR